MLSSIFSSVKSIIIVSSPPSTVVPETLSRTGSVLSIVKTSLSAKVPVLESTLIFAEVESTLAVESQNHVPTSTTIEPEYPVLTQLEPSQ